LNNTTAQTITVTATGDTTPEGAHNCVIQHAITASNDSTNFPTTLAVANVIVAITDNDPGVIITQSGKNTAVAEGGASDTYTVALSTQPASDVTVSITPNAQVTVDKTSLTFTTTDWDTAQTVTVTAVDDTNYEGNHSGSVAHAITTGDGANYPESMTIGSVSVSISDNDSPPLPPPPPPAPPSVEYNLDLKTDGTGKGKITGKSSGRYTSGSQIKLTAEPTDDSSFVGWKPETCGEVFYLSSDTACTATFELATFSLSVETAGSGSGQININPIGNSHLANTTINLTAIPADGSTLVRWVPESCGQSFQLITNTKCTAWFETVVVPNLPQDGDTPQSENTPTRLIKPLVDYVITTGEELQPIVLNEYFSGAEALNYQVVSSPQESAAFISQGSNGVVQLSFNLILLKVGTTSFTVRATDKAGLFVESSFLVTTGSSEPEVQPQPTEPTPETPKETPNQPSNTVSATSPCAITTAEYPDTCNAAGRAIPALQHIKPRGVIADVLINQRVKNEGWLINLVVGENGHIDGGKLSGSVENLGIIEEIEFKGKYVQGGVLAGHIRNTSPVNGVIKNVQFRAGSVLEGGRVGGEIKGDPTNPVRLKGVIITTGSYLSHVIIDETSKLLEGVIFGEGVRFSSEFPCQGNGLSVHHGEQSNVCFKRLKDIYQITTAPEHRGKVAQVIFAAADATSEAYSFDGQQWQRIPVDIAEILTAVEIDSLPLTLEVALPDLNHFIAVFIGYRLADGEIVYYQVK
jgi:hypothetical protein